MATPTIRAAYRNTEGHAVFPQLAGLSCPHCKVAFPAELLMSGDVDELQDGSKYRCVGRLGGCGERSLLRLTPDGWGLMKADES